MSALDTPRTTALGRGGAVLRVALGLVQVAASLVGFLVGASAFVFGGIAVLIGRFSPHQPGLVFLAVGLVAASVLVLLGAGRVAGGRGQLGRAGEAALVLLLAFYAITFGGGWFLVVALTGMVLALVPLIASPPR